MRDDARLNFLITKEMMKWNRRNKMLEFTQVMVLEVKRKQKLTACTIGEMYINGVFKWYTMEDKVREIVGRPVEKWKVPRETAIPSGEYEVVISMSTRFKKLMPEILNVPGFAGIRIHCGNTAADTEGCILLGKTKLPESIGDSKKALDEFFPMLQKAISEKQKIILRIS